MYYTTNNERFYRVMHFVDLQTATHTHTQTHPFNVPLSGTTRVSLYKKKVKPIWILLKQETVSGSGISWDICKSASRSRQITMPVPQRLASRDQPRLDRRCHQPVVKASYDGVTGTKIWNID